MNVSPSQSHTGAKWQAESSGISKLTEKLNDYAIQKIALETIQLSLLNQNPEPENRATLKERVIRVLATIPLEDLSLFLMPESSDTPPSPLALPISQEALLGFPQSALFCAMSVQMGNAALSLLDPIQAATDLSCAMQALIQHKTFELAAEMAQRMPEDKKIFSLTKVMESALDANFFATATRIADLFPEGAMRQAAREMIEKASKANSEKVDVNALPPLE